MAAAAAEELEPEAEPERLAELLEAGWRLLDEVEGGAEASSGAAAVQRKVQRGIRLLERAERAVAELQLFSRNEELEELASADLRFMLVPALLAALVLRQGGPKQRLEHLLRARASFVKFLGVCKDYALGQCELPPQPDSPEEGEAAGHSRRLAAASDQAALLAMAAKRQAKIGRSVAGCHRCAPGPQSRYKQKKEVEKQLASLKPSIDSGQAEEEQLREFYILQIKKWITISLEEIESIDQEIMILSQREALKQDSPLQPPHPSRPPVKPFILTRDTAQAKVFGAGYPSLATMTVNDWYEQHRKRGVLPDQGVSQKASGTEEQQAKQEEKKEQEEDDDEAVWKAREWDEWKDLHPRGYGNRKNMG
ncbi:immunoglobulin-binding protein 1 isoform X2 [Varanus komodoensis]|uniref:immunoglobulin-binding protein 1 isoform X2 n=1 Tax=Varanus komodoensis TaxID=61221 RepID=UPI001CF77357|nr:immunoglobulin-binding protein 1 isoform X2 [Varanus komodoensis]